MDMQDLSPDLGGENQEQSRLTPSQDGATEAPKAPRRPRTRKPKAASETVAIEPTPAVAAAPEPAASQPSGDQGAGESTESGEPRRRKRRRRRRGRGGNRGGENGDGVQTTAGDGNEAPATEDGQQKPQQQSQQQQQQHRHPQKHGRGRQQQRHQHQQQHQHPHNNGAQSDAADIDELVEPDAPAFERSGVLEILPSGEGRLRAFKDGLVATDEDTIIPRELFSVAPLRSAQFVVAECRMRLPGRRRHGGPRVPRATADRIVSIEGLEPAVYGARKPFAELTALDPQPRLTLEHRGCPPACRLIDLFCPIGYGTRGLIVAPPKAGKTILLQNLAFGIKQNHPEVELIALLIDERPEEVTDFKRNVPAHVIASSNDQDIERHLALGILAIERAKRMVEAGKDVVVLLDSLTRLGRAFNNSRKYGSSGRTMSGGLDSRALEVPKQLFGAARKCEEGGSLTIIATCLVDTGSRADQIIFEEFKGTGNMELILDRTIAERRIFPAINLAASGTRKEHLLMGDNEFKTVTALRRRLLAAPPPMQIEQLLGAVKRYETNELMVGGAS